MFSNKLAHDSMMNAIESARDRQESIVALTNNSGLSLSPPLSSITVYHNNLPFEWCRDVIPLIPTVTLQFAGIQHMSMEEYDFGDYDHDELTPLPIIPEVIKPLCYFFGTPIYSVGQRKQMKNKTMKTKTKKTTTNILVSSLISSIESSVHLFDINPKAKPSKHLVSNDSYPLPIFDHDHDSSHMHFDMERQVIALQDDGETSGDTLTKLHSSQFIDGHYQCRQVSPECPLLFNPSSPCPMESIISPKAQHTIDTLTQYAIKNQAPARSTSDLSPLESWLIDKLWKEEERKEILNKANYGGVNNIDTSGYIKLTPHEIRSNDSRERWAEGLILQLPEDHEGRNSWLLNYGVGFNAALKRVNKGLKFNKDTQA